jgi:hypothetical protein
VRLVSPTVLVLLDRRDVLHGVTARGPQTRHPRTSALRREGEGHLEALQLRAGDAPEVHPVLRGLAGEEAASVEVAHNRLSMQAVAVVMVVVVVVVVDG